MHVHVITFYYAYRMVGLDNAEPFCCYFGNEKDLRLAIKFMKKFGEIADSYFV